MAEPTPSDFFKALYRHVTEGQIDIRLIDKGGSVSPHFTKIDELANEKWPTTKNSYFAVASRNGGRTKEHIKQIPALWVDIDFKDTPKSEADDLILGFDIQPSAIVGSGGGYHCYWFLEPPLPKVDNVLEVESILRGLKDALKGDEKATDASRILRAPGSLNVKYDPPPKVMVLALRPTYYSFSSFLAYKTNNILYTKIASTVPEMGDASKFFTEGRRDADIFHTANCLAKGGADPKLIEKILRVLASSACVPPFDQKQIPIKIQSALNREERSEKALAEEVREWCCRQPGVMMSSDVAKELGLSSRVAMKNLSKILSRLCEDQVIEKYGNKRGCFRVVDKAITVQEWWNDEGESLPVKFPLGIEYFTKVFPGNIILVEGEKSQGKSTFALEFCRMNKDLFPGKIMYQNVEMADSELLDRFRAYGDVMTVTQWRESVIFIKQRQDWQDHISPDGLNVVDYLIEYKEPYKLPDIIFEIHKKIKKGIALLLIQRDPFKPYGTGGSRIRDIPRVVLSLMKHKCRIEDVKSFHPTEYGNPKGLSRPYKHVSWWELRPDGSWEFEEEQKYAAFKGGK